MTTTANTTKMNIILVHGAWADASSWSKVIDSNDKDSALDKIESLKPRAVIASHKRPGNDDNPRIIEETDSIYAISTGWPR